MTNMWLPTVVNGLLVAIVVLYMRANKADNAEKVERVESQVKNVEARLKTDEEEYLTEDKHELLCRNAQLELKAYIGEVMASMAAQFDIRFDELEKLIKNGNK